MYIAMFWYILIYWYRKPFMSLRIICITIWSSAFREQLLEVIILIKKENFNHCKRWQSCVCEDALLFLLEWQNYYCWIQSKLSWKLWKNVLLLDIMHLIEIWLKSLGRTSWPKCYTFLSLIIGQSLYSNGILWRWTVYYMNVRCVSIEFNHFQSPYFKI